MINRFSRPETKLLYSVTCRIPATSSDSTAPSQPLLGSIANCGEPLNAGFLSILGIQAVSTATDMPPYFMSLTTGSRMNRARRAQWRFGLNSGRIDWGGKLLKVADSIGPWAHRNTCVLQHERIYQCELALATEMLHY
jgi:hypothetical protein